MHPSESEHAPVIRPPRLNGRYLVARLIGRGAQARVYLAFDNRLKQWRAVKVLAASALEDEHVRARFEQEAQAMARLTHPNLLRVVDVDHDGNTPYMVMELARGGAITEWMKRNGPVPPQLACRIAQACCHGLGHAHTLGVVHRDVKPHNVLIRDDGSVALTDFGIAQVAEGITLTATGTIMGTFAFMAPEQRTDAKGVDPRADVYSLGATLFTMLTGKTSAELFFAESRDGILRGVPDALRPVILTACRYEREQRYPSMMALYDALERRIGKLPPDPEFPALNATLLTVPAGPPDWVDADAGVDELARALAASVEESLTMVPPVAPIVAPDSVLTPSPLPYKMPSVRGARTVPDPARKPAANQVPDYVDTETAPRKTPLRKHRRVEIDDMGARSVHDAKPRPARRSRDVTQLAVVATALAALALVAATVLGIGGKVYTSHRLAAASEVLTRTAVDEQQVITELVAAGAPEEPLIARWAAIDDAAPHERAAAAAAFVSAVERSVAELDREVEPLTASHVSQLSRALREFDTARASQEQVRSSLIGQLTGPIGLY